MWLQYLLFPIPMALVWILLTNRASIPSFLIGYTLSFGLAVLLTRHRRLIIYAGRFPDQFITLVIYLLVLARDIFLSGIDVTLRIVGIRPLRPGIIAVPIQCDEGTQQVKEIVAGSSAHGITITPGEMVVDFDEDNAVMYVHCLDVDHSAPKLDKDQAQRVKNFRRILGV
jgi:multisubunit Na+/H+ antiporter MnhE subunit